MRHVSFAVLLAVAACHPPAIDEEERLEALEAPPVIPPALAPEPAPPPPGDPVSFAAHVQPILMQSCGGYCHFWSRDKLVGVTSVGCDGRARVAPGSSDPAASFLVAKISGIHLCANSEQMPPYSSGLPKLSAEQVQLIRTWIDQGAGDN